jgi:hypothetical protein
LGLEDWSKVLITEQCLAAGREARRIFPLQEESKTGQNFMGSVVMVMTGEIDHAGTI